MNDEAKAPIDFAEIIYEKPSSGAFEEVLFGSDRGNTLWVLFSEKGGGREWIGKFGCGFTTMMRVTKVAVPDHFLVVAGGAAYLVDATERQQLNFYSEPHVQDVAYDAQNAHFISGDVCLWIIECGRKIWTSERFSVDYITNLSVEGRTLSGTAVVDYDGKEDCFSFDLDTRKFISGPGSSDKPWWKFWV